MTEERVKIDQKTMLEVIKTKLSPNSMQNRSLQIQGGEGTSSKYKEAQADSFNLLKTKGKAQTLKAARGKQYKGTPVQLVADFRRHGSQRSIKEHLLSSERKLFSSQNSISSKSILPE